MRVTKVRLHFFSVKTYVRSVERDGLRLFRTRKL